MSTVKKFGEIVMLVAVIFLLMHSVIPHQHHTDKEGYSLRAVHSCSGDLFGLIQFTFHSNPGEHHLEEFQPGSEFGFTFLSLSSPGIYYTPTYFSLSKGENYPNQVFVPDPPDPSTLHFRGPPSLS